MTSEPSRLFRGGVPLSPDVERLMQHFGDVAVGQVIEHAQLESVLGTHRRSARYRSVLTAFRKKMLQLRQRVLDGRCVPGVGLKCLTDEQTVGHIGDRMRSLRRETGRLRVKAATVDVGALSEIGRAGFEMEQRVMAAIHVAVTPTRLPSQRRLTIGS